MHENWPITMKEAYRGGYWAETAFPQSYQEAFTDVTRQFAQHLSAKGWTTTRFLGFLNNKVDFKKRGWSRGSSIWLLDEPASFQDFDALAYYGRAFHRALAPHQSSGPFARMEFRADISRPQWQRDLMDGVLQYNVISQSAFRQYHRLVMDRKWRTDQSIMVYGTTNHPTTSNSQALAWCWDSWCRGADGVVPCKRLVEPIPGTKRMSWRCFILQRMAPRLPRVLRCDSKRICMDNRIRSYCDAVPSMPNWIDMPLANSCLSNCHSVRCLGPMRRSMKMQVWADYGALRPELITQWRRLLAAWLK